VHVVKKITDLAKLDALERLEKLFCETQSFVNLQRYASSTNVNMLSMKENSLKNYLCYDTHLNTSIASKLHELGPQVAKNHKIAKFSRLLSSYTLLSALSAEK